MRIVLVLALCIGGVVGVQSSTPTAQQPVKTMEDGALDKIVLYATRLPATASTPVVMLSFSGLDANLGTGSEGGKKERQQEAQTIKMEGPKVLGERFVATLKELGPFGAVSLATADASAPAGSIVVDGKFTKIDPGSRTKRYFVGFGAGKSAVAVTGTVKDANGTRLATFQQTRYGVMGMGGGDSLGKLLSDSRTIGEDIAKFLSAWAMGKALD